MGQNLLNQAGDLLLSISTGSVRREVLGDTRLLNQDERRCFVNAWPERDADACASRDDRGDSQKHPFPPLPHFQDVLGIQWPNCRWVLHGHLPNGISAKRYSS